MEMRPSKFRRALQAGEVLFREGEPGDCAYLIEQGEIEVYRNVSGQRSVLAVLKPGDVVGEMAVIDQLPRTASAMAKTEARLRTISAAHLQKQLDTAHPMIRVLLQLVVKRYRNTMSDGGTGDGLSGADREAALAHMRLSQELEEAVQQNQFALHYQPIVDLERMTIRGFEALVRWHHPERGVLLPADFLPALEESGLIHEAGRWILLEACQALNRINTPRLGRGLDPLFMTVNISGRQLETLDPVLNVLSALERSGIDPRLLVLEITESALVINMDAAAQFVARCHDLGVRVAVDDFGSGFSSLNYLHRFKVDAVKIDRSFVAPMLQDPESMKILGVITELGRALDLTLIAEGVERTEQAAALQGMGIELVQGFLFSEAVHEPSTEELLDVEWPWSFDRRTSRRRSTDRRED